MKKFEKKKQIVETENLELKQKMQKLQDDLEKDNNTVAVNDMLHVDFKEIVQEKYGYDTNDQESDYEPEKEKKAD